LSFPFAGQLNFFRVDDDDKVLRQGAVCKPVWFFPRNWSAT